MSITFAQMKEKFQRKGTFYLSDSNHQTPVVTADGGQSTSEFRSPANASPDDGNMVAAKSPSFTF